MENDNIISDKIVLLDNSEEFKEIFLNIISNGKYIYKDLLME